MTVCGKVYSTRALTGGPTFINMGGDYPDNPLTAVIMFDKRSSFSYKPEDNQMLIDDLKEQINGYDGERILLKSSDGKRACFLK